MNNQVSFGAGNNKKGGFGNTLGAIKDSAISVGIATAAGGAVGAVGGGLATLIPYKPTEAAMNFQYADMFEKALRNKEIPDYLKNSSSDVLDIVKSNKAKIKSITTLKEKLLELEILKAAAQSATEEAIKDDAFQQKVKDIFKEKAESIPAGGYTKDDIISKIGERTKKITAAVEKRQPNIDEEGKKFVEHLRNLKNETIDEIATKGAKHLRNKTVLGAGIAIGIFSALVLNLLRAWGVIGKKKSQPTAPPTANQNTAQ